MLDDADESDASAAYGGDHDAVAGENGDAEYDDGNSEGVDACDECGDNVACADEGDAMLVLMMIMMTFMLTNLNILMTRGVKAMK